MALCVLRVRLARCALAVASLLHAGRHRPPPTSTSSLDQAKLVKLPERVATIVIGNPVIADASVQAGGWMVITGKGYGITNLIALDRSGAVLMEKTVEVQGPAPGRGGRLQGVERETYSCTPDCERRITLGDGPAYFEVDPARPAPATEPPQGCAAGRSDPRRVAPLSHGAIVASASPSAWLARP